MQPARARRETVGFARLAPTMPRQLQPGLAAHASACNARVAVAARGRPSGRIGRSASDAVGSPTGGHPEANRNGHFGGRRLRGTTWGSALERIGASSIGAHGSSPHSVSAESVARDASASRARRRLFGGDAESTPRCRLFGGQVGATGEGIDVNRQEGNGRSDAVRLPARGNLRRVRQRWRGTGSRPGSDRKVGSTTGPGETQRTPGPEPR